MTAGQLTVHPETIRGLPSKLNNAQLFVGCFVQESEKHRTHSRSGPEIRWENTLTCNMPRNQGDLNIELVNENPSNGGVVATGRVSLRDVCERGHESKWVPLYSNSNESFGELKLNLSFKSNDSVGSMTSSFGGMDLNKNQHGSYNSNENSRQSSFASLGPANPIPQNYGVGNPPPFTPPAAVSYAGEGNSYMPSNNSFSSESAKNLLDKDGVVSPDKMTPREFEEAKAKGKLPNWAKYGGGALAGVAALGLSAWGAHELKEHFDKKEEEEKKHQQGESKPFVIPPGYLQPEKQHSQPTPQHQNQQYPVPPQQHVNHQSASSHPSHVKDKRDEKDEKKKCKKQEKEEKKKMKKEKKHKNKHDSSSSSSDSSDDERHHKMQDKDWK
ncbi:hypothetical protein BD560DRAFT_410777 [Blakeslea trispora]|nr:hypothetical protein BD560DRAFT_410777 [Blakeslea trispora]